MDKELAIRLHKRCRTYAIKRGYSELADDFAQEAFIGWAKGWKQTIAQAFIEFLRSNYGNTRTPSGRARKRAENSAIRLDAPIGEDESGALAHDVVGLPEEYSEPRTEVGGFGELFTGRKFHIFERYFIDQAAERVIGEELCISEARVSQIIKGIRNDIVEQARLEDAMVEYETDPRFTVLQIDWIRL